jgi:uncharacterized membrane protein
MKNKLNPLNLKASVLGLILATGSMALTACDSNSSPSVECKGVGKNGPNSSVLMTKGMCAKIAGGVATPTTEIYKDPGANSYVECYGVVAAGENDCATNTSACGGTNTVNKSTTAWIAIPQGICSQLDGGIIGKLSKSSVGPSSS